MPARNALTAPPVTDQYDGTDDGRHPPTQEHHEVSDINCSYSNMGASAGAVHKDSEIENRLAALSEQVERCDNLSHQVRSRFGNVLTPEGPEVPQRDRDPPRIVDKLRSPVADALASLSHRLDKVADHLQQTLNRAEL